MELAIGESCFFVFFDRCNIITGIVKTLLFFTPGYLINFNFVFVSKIIPFTHKVCEQRSLPSKRLCTAVETSALLRCEPISVQRILTVWGWKSGYGLAKRLSTTAAGPGLCKCTTEPRTKLSFTLQQDQVRQGRGIPGQVQPHLC